MINVLKYSKLNNNSYSLQPNSKLFVYLNVLDLLSTMIAINLGAFETNPIYAQFGWGAHLLVKTILVFLMIFYYEFCYRITESKWKKFILFSIFALINLDMIKLIIENTLVIFNLIQ